MIDAFVDGRLTATDHDLMVHHISSCTECAAAVIAALAEAARTLAAESSERAAGWQPGIAADGSGSEAPVQDLLQLDLILDRSTADPAQLLLKPEPVSEVSLDELPVTRAVELVADMPGSLDATLSQTGPGEVPVEDLPELDENAIAGMTAAGVAHAAAHGAAALAADAVPEAEEEVAQVAEPVIEAGEAIVESAVTAADEVVPAITAADDVAPAVTSADETGPAVAAIEIPAPSVEPAPVEPAPVEPAPVEPAPVEPAPVELEVGELTLEPAAAELEIAEPALEVSAQETSVPMDLPPVAVVEEGDGGFRIKDVTTVVEASPELAEPPHPRGADRIPDTERAMLREHARMTSELEAESRPGRRWSFVATATVALLVFAALGSYAAVQLRAYAALERGPPPVPVVSERAPAVAMSVLAPVLDSAAYTSVIDVPTDSAWLVDSVAWADTPGRAVAATPDSAAGRGTAAAGGTAARNSAAGATPDPAAARAGERVARTGRSPAAASAGELPRILRTTTHRPRPEVDFVLREYDAAGPTPSPRPGVNEYRWFDSATTRLYVLSGRAPVEELRAYARLLRAGRDR